MPIKRTANAVRLAFTLGCLVKSNLSGTALTGGWLRVAGDKARGLNRLRQLAPVGSESRQLGEVRNLLRLS